LFQKKSCQSKIQYSFKINQSTKDTIPKVSVKFGKKLKQQSLKEFLKEKCLLVFTGDDTTE